MADWPSQKCNIHTHSKKKKKGGWNEKKRWIVCPPHHKCSDSSTYTLLVNFSVLFSDTVSEVVVTVNSFRFGGCLFFFLKSMTRLATLFLSPQFETISTRLAQSQTFCPIVRLWNMCQKRSRFSGTFPVFIYCGLIYVYVFFWNFIVSRRHHTSRAKEQLTDTRSSTDTTNVIKAARLV